MFPEHFLWSGTFCWMERIEEGTVLGLQECKLDTNKYTVKK